MSLIFRKASDKDRSLIIDIFEVIIRKGGTYVQSENTPRKELEDYWYQPAHHVYTALLEDEIVGSFWLCENHPDHGAHIANAAYIISPDSSGKGIGRNMAKFSLNEAKNLGFHAIQFNYVIASNIAAVNLWKKVGFEIIGTIPKGFKDVKFDYSDVYIMHKALK